MTKIARGRQKGDKHKRTVRAETTIARFVDAKSSRTGEVGGEVGELLRREGLYTSHLTYWRKQRKDGALKELSKPRGRKPVDRRDQEIAALERKLERSEAELAKMKRVVEIQGNVSALLEEMLGEGSAPRSTER
jgi:hypothetical protein